MKIHTQRNFATPLFLLFALAACADKDGGQEAVSTAQSSAAGNPGAMPLPKVEEASLSPEHIMKHIYLGQAYPSGNVYLRRFQESENTVVSWPDTVTYRALTSNHPYASVLHSASFSNVMNDVDREVESGILQLETAYIPALEQMDDSHEGCTEHFYKPKNPVFEYLGDYPDFFGQMLFNCNSNEGIAVYNGDDTGTFSFPVVAVDKQLVLSDIQLFSEKARPLTAEESKQLAKADLATNDDEFECTTVATQIDSAKMLMSASVADSDMSIRISNYTDPGCGGHLSEIFIFDFLRAGKVLEKYELSQYKGGI